MILHKIRCLHAQGYCRSPSFQIPKPSWIRYWVWKVKILGLRWVRGPTYFSPGIPTISHFCSRYWTSVSLSHTLCQASVSHTRKHSCHPELSTRTWSSSFLRICEFLVNFLLLLENKIAGDDSRWKRREWIKSLVELRKHSINIRS